MGMICDVVIDLLKWCSEYIIDLMGAPGTLIPPEVPSSHLTDAGFDVRGFASPMEILNCSSLLLGDGSETLRVSPNLDRVPQVGNSRSEGALFLGSKTNEGDTNLVEKNQTLKFENEFGKLFASSHKSNEIPSGTGKSSSAQNIKVKNVSKYVINAAKNPEFAQKLHAVLLESGASPPLDLFSDMNLGKQKVLGQVHIVNGVNQDDGLHCHSDKFISSEDSLSNVCCDYEQEQSAKGLAEQQRGLETNVLKSEVSFPSDTTSDGFVLVHNRNSEKLQINATGVDIAPVKALEMLGKSLHENQIQESSLPSAMDSYQLQPEYSLASDDNQCFQEKMGRIFNVETAKETAVKLIETSNSGLRIACNGYSERINPMLGEVAEWEIPWEDLQIGERIGIGKNSFL